jgi:thiol-disulfide isomerase/thioredoxin
MNKSIYITGLLLLVLTGAPAARAEDRGPLRTTKINKLLYMYLFYYLPFSVEFREGRTANDILPFFPSKIADASRLLSADELQSLDSEWNTLKEPWKKKSLLLATAVPSASTVRITQHLASHRIPLSRSAFDTLSLSDRIQLNEVLRSKAPEVQSAFKQLRFLKSFLQPSDEDKLNFFMVSASWCESCREYRVLMESYFKTFPNQDLVLHSLVIDDPKEEIFDSKLLKELFPNPAKYSHDSIPRFLALENLNGKTTVYEEGEALLELYERYFKQHRGYVDNQTSLFRGRGPASVTSSPGATLGPSLSSGSR